MAIIVYGKPKCVYCELVKQKLEDKQVPYEYVDINQSAEAKMLLKSRGLDTVPQIFVRNVYKGDSQVVDRIIREYVSD